MREVCPEALLIATKMAERQMSGQDDTNVSHVSAAVSHIRVRWIAARYALDRYDFAQK